MSLDPFLSVVIVNWNAAALLKSCLAALREEVEAEGATHVEVIVVDNGSLDSSLAVARDVYAAVSLIELPENVGFAAGCNAGFSVASGEWIATLNNDVVVERGWLGSLRRAATKCDERCGMLQPHVLLAGLDKRVQSTGVVVTRTGNVRDRSRDVEEQSGFGPGAEVFCASASAAWYRRRMLDGVARGGPIFRPEYFMYFEDVDLGWRARLAGWSAQYVPEAIAVHAAHASAARQTGGFVRRQCARNRMRLLLANGSASLVLRAGPRLLKDAVWLLLDGGPCALGGISSALRDGFEGRRSLPSTWRNSRAALERRWIE